MVDVAKVVLEFLIIFLIIYFLSYFLSVKKIKKFDRKKMPSNVKYLVYKYNIDVVKIGYKSVCKLLTLTDSFIIALLFSVTKFMDNIYIRLITCCILIFPLFAGMYYLIALYYKRKED